MKTTAQIHPYVIWHNGEGWAMIFRDTEKGRIYAAATTALPRDEGNRIMDELVQFFKDEGPESLMDEDGELGPVLAVPVATIPRFDEAPHHRFVGVHPDFLDSGAPQWAPEGEKK